MICQSNQRLIIFWFRKRYIQRFIKKAISDRANSYKKFFFDLVCGLEICDCVWCAEVRIYKRKQESKKKERKHALDQEKRFFSFISWSLSRSRACFLSFFFSWSLSWSKMCSLVFLLLFINSHLSAVIAYPRHAPCITDSLWLTFSNTGWCKNVAVIFAWFFTSFGNFLISPLNCAIFWDFRLNVQVLFTLYFWSNFFLFHKLNKM